MGWMLVALVFLVFLGLRPTVVVVSPEVHVEINQEGSTGIWPPWDPLAISGENKYEFEGEREAPTEG